MTLFFFQLVAMASARPLLLAGRDPPQGPQTVQSDVDRKAPRTKGVRTGP